MIRFNVEQLYHFHCGECGRWFSIGDWQPPAEKPICLTCPHCDSQQEVEAETRDLTKPG